VSRNKIPCFCIKELPVYYSLTPCGIVFDCPELDSAKNTRRISRITNLISLLWLRITTCLYTSHCEIEMNNFFVVMINIADIVNRVFINTANVDDSCRRKLNAFKLRASYATQPSFATISPSSVFCFQAI
jgi:hypothetical protein